MLFDLQSRRRRTAVKVIYGFLALLMGGGLVLLGVGVGNGNGGLLNAFSNNNGSSGNSAQNTAVNQQLRAAEKRVKAQPDSASAWSNMLQARWVAANSDANYNASTGQYSAGGHAQLTQATTAWTHYTSLVKGKPNESTTLLAARAYSVSGDFKGASVVWQDFIAANAGQLKGYECLALTAYASKNKNLGDQAAAKAVSLAPKIQRLTTQQSFSAAKSAPATAKGLATSEGC